VCAVWGYTNHMPNGYSMINISGKPDYITSTYAYTGWFEEKIGQAQDMENFSDCSELCLWYLHFYICKIWEMQQRYSYSSSITAPLHPGMPGNEVGWVGKHCYTSCNFQWTGAKLKCWIPGAAWFGVWNCYPMTCNCLLTHSRCVELVYQWQPHADPIVPVLLTSIYNSNYVFKMHILYILNWESHHRIGLNCQTKCALCNCQIYMPLWVPCCTRYPPPATQWLLKKVGQHETPAKTSKCTT